MSQQDSSREAVERLVAELATTSDPSHADALASQIGLHAELAAMSAEDVAALAAKAAPAKQGKASKAAEG